MLTDKLEFRASGASLRDCIKEGFDEFLHAVCLYEDVDIEGDVTPNWVLAPNVTIAYSFYQVLEELWANDQSDVESWVVNLYEFNQMSMGKLLLRESVNSLYFGTEVSPPIKSASEFASRSRKVVGMLLFFLAKRRAIRLPLHFNFPTTSNGLFEFCGKSLPVHIKLARAIKVLSRKKHDHNFAEFELPIEASEIEALLTDDDILHIPTYVTKAFVSLDMLDLKYFDSKKIRALHQWHRREHKFSKYVVLSGYSKVLSIVLDRLGYAEESAEFRALATNIFEPVDEAVINAFDGSIEVRKRKKQRKAISPLNNSYAPCILIDGVSYRYFSANEAKQEINENFFGIIGEVKNSEAYPSVLMKTMRLGNSEISEQEKLWLTLQIEFLNHSKFESSRTYMNSFGYLNRYIFGYLRFWFQKNANVPYKFPSIPNDFRTAFFIRPIKLNDSDIFPRSLPDFVTAHKLTNTSAQSSLRQIATFFEWIAVYAGHLEGCDSFSAPMTQIDFPKAKRRSKTNKGRFPKRIFPILMSYLYGIHAWMLAEHEAVADGIKTGHSSFVGKEKIDWSDDVAFCPLISIDLGNGERLVPIPWLPNIFNYSRDIPYNGGRCRRKPRCGIVPNSLVQILICLETAQRHQNVQWLDRNSYSKYFAEDLELGYDVVRLFVNTDKIKEDGFEVFGHKRILEVFALQERFLSLIDRDWLTSCYYEGNRESKWGEISCLFQLQAEGKPHSDSFYTIFWNRLLYAFQTFLFDVGYPSAHELSRLLPVGVKPEEDFFIGNDDRRVVKIYAEDSEDPEEASDFVFVEPRSKFSPHSTRSTVVSNALTALPAEFIGNYMTGQTPGVVNFYGVMDREDHNDLYLKYQHQIMKRDKITSDRAEPILTKADSETSNVRQAFEVDAEKAVFDFGCISVASVLDSDDQCGIEIAKVMDTKGFSFGRLRICPLNGFCPSEIVSVVGANNCAECFYAIYSVDHLPAINSEIRNRMDDLYDLKEKLSNSAFRMRLSRSEQDNLFEAKQDLGRRIAAWRAVSMALEMNREHLITRDTFLVGRPELVQKKIEKIDGNGLVADGLMLRLQEAVAYPLATSQKCKAQLKRVTRKLLVFINKIDEYEYLLDVDDPSRELEAMLRTVAKAYQVTPEEVVDMLVNGIDSKALIGSNLHVLSSLIDGVGGE